MSHLGPSRYLDMAWQCPRKQGETSDWHDSPQLVPSTMGRRFVTVKLKVQLAFSRTAFIQLLLLISPHCNFATGLPPRPTTPQLADPGTRIRIVASVIGLTRLHCKVRQHATPEDNPLPRGNRRLWPSCLASIAGRRLHVHRTLSEPRQTYVCTLPRNPSQPSSIQGKRARHGSHQELYRFAS